jgi:hypothetical protein
MGYTKQSYTFYLLDTVNLVQLDRSVRLKKKSSFKRFYFLIGHGFLSAIFLLYYYYYPLVP